MEDRGGNCGACYGGAQGHGDFAEFAVRDVAGHVFAGLHDIVAREIFQVAEFFVEGFYAG